MDYFKEASRLNLEFNTSLGVLSVFQLWQLKLPKLAVIIKNLKSELDKNNTSSDLVFLDDTKTIDRNLELRFNVAKEIYITKRDEENLANTTRLNKEHNEKVMAIIAKKQDDELNNKSVEELLAMIK